MEHQAERASLRNEAVDVGAVLRAWGRRALTVSLYVIACIAILSSLPALIIIAAVTDMVRRSKFAGVRFILMLAFYFCCEVAGIAMSFLLWARKVLTRASRESFLDWNFALQQWWAGSLFRAGRRLFSIRVEVEGADGLGEGSFIVFIRHVSLGDTLLPSTILSKRYGLRLRFVLKSQLLWIPVWT